MRRLVVVTAVVLVLVCLSGAAPADRPVVIAVGGDVDSFNEYVAASTLAIDLADQLYLNLMEESADLSAGPPSFTPRLARAWEFAPDGLSVTLHLREDVLWSDGRETTSADVLYTWQSQTDAELGWPDAELKTNIASVEAPDAHTVIFKLRKRTPYTLLEINEGHILPRHALETIPREQWHQTDFSKNLVTNGPYRLAAWNPGESIELARNPGYYEKGLPGIGRVVFRIVTDPAIRLQQVFAGETDVLEGVPPEAVSTVTTDRLLRLMRFDQRMYTYICWNNRRPMFADPKVRRALTMALDREEMLAVLAKRMGRPAAGPMVSSLWAASRTLESIPHDPAASRGSLKEAGWEDHDGDGVVDKEGKPFTLEIEFNRGNTLRENLALRIASQLSSIGVKAVPRAVEWAAFQKKHRDGDFDAFVASRIVPTRVDLESFVTGDSSNYAAYGNAEVDSLVARAREAATLDEARPLWEKAQQIIVHDQPVTFLFEQDRLYAVARRILGVEPGPLGLLATLRKWRLGPAPAQDLEPSD